jgi:two-component system invasion response regulator UvrY
MIRVIVVDDHPVVREGLKRILAENTGMVVTGEAADGYEALEVIRSEPCDVVLLDLAIPHKNGLDVLKQLQAEKPRLPVLILSNYSEDQYAIRCIRAGAAGYLKKETALPEVVVAIRQVLRGRKYVSENVAEKLVFNLHSAERPLHQALTDREYQIVCMIASGKVVNEIGEELALSVKTVSTYRARLLKKLKMRNNAELIRYAIKEGLVN